jgi:hypothetical protein
MLQTGEDPIVPEGKCGMSNFNSFRNRLRTVGTPASLQHTLVENVDLMPEMNGCSMPEGNIDFEQPKASPNTASGDERTALRIIIDDELTDSPIPRRSTGLSPHSLLREMKDKSKLLQGQGTIFCK